MSFVMFIFITAIVVIMYFTVCSLFWGLDFYILFATFFNVFLGNSKEVYTTAIKMAQKWFAAVLFSIIT